MCSHLENLFKSKIFIGDQCEKEVDYCEQNPCESYLTCLSFPFEEQIASNKTYYCNGTCPTSGYKKDANGHCIDINECEIPGSCPATASCINLIGSFSCECKSGYKYQNNICEGKLVIDI